MDNYLVRSARASVRLNMSMTRGVSAFRRALIILVVYSGGATLIGAQAGQALAIGAIFGGFLDRGDTSTRVAAHAGFALAAGTLIFGSAAAVLGHITALGVVAIVLCAAAGGFASAVSLNAARIVTFTAVLAVISVIGAPSVDTALYANAFIALGVFVQAVGTWLSLISDSDLTERRRVAEVLEQVAIALDVTANTAVSAVPNRDVIATALATAENVVQTWDLPDDRAQVFLRILESSIECRAEAIASAERHEASPGEAADPALQRQTAQLLRTAGYTLRAHSWNRHRRLAEFRALADLMPATVAVPNHSADAVLLRSSQAIANGVIEVIANAHFTRGKLGRTQSRPEVLRHNTGPGSTARQHAKRLAFAAFIGCVVALMIDVEYSEWVAMTAIVVLRPDIPSTSIRTIGRTVGTFVGGFVVVAAAFVVPDSTIALAAVAFAFAVFGYAYQLVNYAFFVGGTVGVIVLLESVGHEAPEHVALERILFVVIGSAIAIVASWVVPIWKSTTVAGSLAAYAEAVSDWLWVFSSELANGILAQTEHGQRTQQIRSRIAAARSALSTADAEPLQRRVDIEAAHEVEAAITATLRSAQGSVAPLLERQRPAPRAAVCAAHAAADLSYLAVALRTNSVLRLGPGGSAGESVIDSELAAEVGMNDVAQISELRLTMWQCLRDGMRARALADRLERGAASATGTGSQANRTLGPRSQ